METYSSPSGRAICSAAPSALTNSRDSVGSATLGPAALRQALHRAGGGPAHVGRVGADRAQQRGGGGAAGVEQREQQVPRLDRGVAALGGDGDRGGDDLAALGGQALGVHVSLCTVLTWAPVAAA